VLEGTDSPELQVNVLDQKVRLGRLGARDLTALPYLGQGEQGFVAGVEDIRPETLALGPLADGVARPRRCTDADGAEAVGDVGVLSTRGEAVPNLGRDGAVDILDEEVSAVLGRGELAVHLVVELIAVHLVVELIDLPEARERKPGEIDLHHLQGVVKRDAVLDCPIAH
jgi:hypothetical protein